MGGASLLDPGSYFFNGSIDDVRVYNRALSASEVMQVYKAGAATLGAAPLNPIATGLVGYWTFDGKNLIQNATDSSGQGNSGYLMNFTATTTAVGKLGQALSFNGTTNYVSAPTSTSGIKSAAFWVKTSNTGAQGLINLTGSTVFISTNASKVISGTGFTSPVYYVDGIASTTPGLYDAKWHHIVVTSTAGFTGNQIEMGRANSQYFSGQLDDVRLYGHTLTATEAMQLAKSGQIKTTVTR